MCLPLFSNRGHTLGALYMASKNAFSEKTYTVMALLVQQASISIANALLFRSVQAGTRENLKMIQTQKEALEAARKSREEALQATKVSGHIGIFGFLLLYSLLLRDLSSRSRALFLQVRPCSYQRDIATDYRRLHSHVP